MKKALVTGAAGFIGRYTARALARQGYTVTGVGHGSWSRDAWQEWGLADWHAADVTFDTLSTYANSPEVIVHCAGGASVPYSMSHPYQDFLRSVDTTAALMEYVRLHAREAKTIFVSSTAVYGKVVRQPIGEDTPLNPVSHYGVHKRMSEDLCRSFAANFGHRVAIMRLFSAYGVGLRKQLLWDTCRKIQGGETEFFGSGEEVRDFIHVEDVASLLVTAVGHADVTCPVINGGTGGGQTVAHVVGQLFNAFGRKDKPVFTGKPRPGDPDAYVADIGRAKSWGWKPVKNLDAELTLYAEWFKKEHP